MFWFIWVRLFCHSPQFILPSPELPFFLLPPPVQEHCRNIPVLSTGCLPHGVEKPVAVAWVGFIQLGLWCKTS